MKKLKATLILGILLVLYIFISAYSYVLAISDNLYNSVFRLHVIANSDSAEDQNLKYLVRDNVLNFMNNQADKLSNKEDAMQYAKEHISAFEKIAKDTIIKNGYDYPVTVEVGNYSFPTKKYGDVSFPTGNYDALRIKIGNSSGKNWWCVMFPPLCFIDSQNGIVSSSSKDSLRENLSTENYKIVSESNHTDIAFKFKLIELFEKTGLITAKK